MVEQDSMTRPNFLIFGVPKAGTTSLYHYVQQHPRIYMSPVKDSRFWYYSGNDDKPDFGTGFENPPPPPHEYTTIEQYEALFNGVTDETAIGEAAHNCLRNPLALERIARYVPDAKLIAILRHPVDRAHSNYVSRIRKGVESDKMEDALNPESHYIQLGFYGTQLKRYLEHFDRSQIHVCFFDDLQTHPVKVLQDIFCYLNVDSSFMPDVSVKHNTGGIPKNKLFNAVWHALYLSPTIRRTFKTLLPKRMKRFILDLETTNRASYDKIPTSLRRKLCDIYKEDVQVLQDLVQRDLSEWLQ